MFLWPHLNPSDCQSWGQSSALQFLQKLCRAVRLHFSEWEFHLNLFLCATRPPPVTTNVVSLDPFGGELSVKVEALFPRSCRMQLCCENCVCSKAELWFCSSRTHLLPHWNPITKAGGSKMKCCRRALQKRRWGQRNSTASCFHGLQLAWTLFLSHYSLSSSGCRRVGADQGLTSTFDSAGHAGARARCWSSCTMLPWMSFNVSRKKQFREKKSFFRFFLKSQTKGKPQQALRDFICSPNWCIASGKFFGLILNLIELSFVCTGKNSKEKKIEYKMLFPLFILEEIL